MAIILYYAGYCMKKRLVPFLLLLPLNCNGDNSLINKKINSNNIQLTIDLELKEAPSSIKFRAISNKIFAYTKDQSVLVIYLQENRHIEIPGESTVNVFESSIKHGTDLWDKIFYTEGEVTAIEIISYRSGGSVSSTISSKKIN